MIELDWKTALNGFWVKLKEIGKNYLGFGVDGVSLSAFVIRLKITTTKQSKIGPNIAPSHPNRNIPPAIDKPVK